MLIKILREDILNNLYYDASKCPITSAFRRAGYENVRHVGLGISLDSYGGTVLCNWDYPDIEELDLKVQAQYALKHNGELDKIEDFEMEVNIPSPNEIKTSYGTKSIS